MQERTKKKLMAQKHKKLREAGIQPATTYEENLKRIKAAHGR